MISKKIREEILADYYKGYKPIYTYTRFNISSRSYHNIVNAEKSRVEVCEICNDIDYNNCVNCGVK